jgi:NADPH:quinone reductase-like Zn-dependent oxidoreductase
MLHWKPFNQADIDELKRLVATGVVAPHLDRRFTLDEAADALRYVQAGQARGKVLVIP